MKNIATMLPDIIRSLFTRPATESYPSIRRVEQDRLRSFLEWNKANCTGCGLCAMDCPSAALELTMIDRKTKRFFLTYYTDKCLFCGQCVVTCRQGSLSMGKEHWELASLNKQDFITHFGETDYVDQTVAGSPENEPDTSK